MNVDDVALLVRLQLKFGRPKGAFVKRPSGVVAPIARIWCHSAVCRRTDDRQVKRVYALDGP